MEFSIVIEPNNETYELLLDRNDFLGTLSLIFECFYPSSRDVLRISNWHDRNFFVIHCSISTHMYEIYIRNRISR